MDSIKIILPFPPSVNHLFAQNKKNARLRFKTKAYKEWIARAEDMVQWADTPIQKCTISYKIFFPDERIRDGQNYMKAPLDFLCKQKIILEDNRKVVKGEQWIDAGTDKKNPRIEVTIKEIT